MKIPSAANDAFGLYELVIRQCLETREKRAARYKYLRNYYLYGTDGQYDQKSVYNKIYPHIDQITSFMYAQDTTMFSVNIGPSVAKGELKKVATLSDAVNYRWHESNCDIVFGSGLQWAHVYGSEFIKMRWNGKKVEPFVVDPHDFGVLREDVALFNRQEAFAQSYWMSRDQLERELRAAEHPRISQIMQQITAQPKQESAGSDLLQKVIVTSATQGLVTGGLNQDLTTEDPYIPRVDEDLVQMHELYVYDDEAQDLRVVTLADPYIVIFDRPINRMFVDREHPFIQLCPVPTHDYFYGISETERLIPLQEMRNMRMSQIQSMMNKQAKPPKTFSGFEAMTDEIALAYDTAGGWASSDRPNAKTEVHSPTIPDDLFMEIREIDMMFEEMSGMTNVLSGRGESGVRSTGHASELAKLGSSRTKKRALIVEDSLEKAATLFLRILQKYESGVLYKDSDNVDFAAHQFTKDFTVKVDAHSNSPIFMEDMQLKAIELLKAKAITRERFLQMMGAPMLQLLVDELQTKIEPQEAAQMQAQMMAESQKGKPNGGPPKPGVQ